MMGECKLVSSSPISISKVALSGNPCLLPVEGNLQSYAIRSLPKLFQGDFLGFYTSGGRRQEV